MSYNDFVNILACKWYFLHAANLSYYAAVNNRNLVKSTPVFKNYTYYLVIHPSFWL